MTTYSRRLAISRFRWFSGEVNQQRLSLLSSVICNLQPVFIGEKMLTSRKFRIRLLPAVVLGALLVSMPMPAHAASKEMIELQTQVQQLLDMVQRLQSTMDTRFGVLQNLTQQTADNATLM